MTIGRASIGLLAAAVATLTAIVRPAPGPAMDRLTFDTLVRRDPVPPDAGTTAIVAIDDASLARFGQWPWPRATVARLVDRLRDLGAVVVAFDVLFAEPDRTDPEGDARLAEAMRRVPTVAGHALVFGRAAIDSACMPGPVALVERQRGSAPPRAGLIEAAGVICTLPAITAAAAAAGFINATPDPDGLLRRVPLLIRYGGGVHAALALAAVAHAAGGGPLVLDTREDGALTLTVGRRAVALDTGGRLLVRHARSMATRPALSAADVLEGLGRPDQVQGRVVFVGATAAGLRDEVTTATVRELPGVAIHAAIADTLLGGAAYERPELAPLAEAGGALVAASLTALVAARFGVAAGAAAALALAAAAWTLARYLLVDHGAYVSPLWPGLAAVLAFGLDTAAAVVRERRRADRERRRHADAQRLIVQTLTTLTETRDPDTGRHARRTQELTRLLATALAQHPSYRTVLDTTRINLIATLAPLHDIGKVGIPDVVLRKPGALSPEEHAQMRRHPDLGYESLLRAEALAGVHDDEVLRLAKEIVHTHHERWDGTGYPRGLRGTDIPVSGRLVALVDAYDALVADRTYREGVSHERAVAAIEEGRGYHFDPDVVDAFLRVQERFRELQRGD